MINKLNSINLTNSPKLWVPRNAKALKCIIVADEGIKRAAVLPSQSDNYVAIMPSAKVVDIEIVWLIFIAVDVQAV
jgi:hypothetical protein